MTVGPVSRILSAIAGGTVIPLRRTLLCACSDLPGTFTHCWGPCGLARRADTHRDYSRIVPYLVLLRVGFAMRRALLPGRCALTAPFHPYRALAGEAVFSLWHFPSSDFEAAVPVVIRHTALRSSDFPPARLALGQRPSGPTVNPYIICDSGGGTRKRRVIQRPSLAMDHAGAEDRLVTIEGAACLRRRRDLHAGRSEVAGLDAAGLELHRF